MTKEERDIQRKLRVLQYADTIGDVSKACHYFGMGRASFYRWKGALHRQDEQGLVNKKSGQKLDARGPAPNE